MPRLSVFLLLVWGAVAAQAPQSVYLLPMASGLDQHLASRLAADGNVRVVTDVKLADAVFTDKLGEGFEGKLAELLRPKEDETAEKKKKEQEERPRLSFQGRSRGNVFLVDPKSRQVIWSTYERSKSAAPEALEKTARQIVERLKKDLFSAAKTPGN